MKRRLLSAFLAVMMVLTMAPVAFAADEETANSTSDSTGADSVGSGSTSGGSGSSEVASAKALQEQINAIQGTGTVTLDKDYTEDITIPVGTDITLNLNGHKITNASDNTITVALGATLTVTGKGTVDNVTHAKAAVWNNGTCYLKGGTYDRSQENGKNANDSGSNSFYAVLNHGTMEINEGATVYQSGHYSSLLENGYQNANSGNQSTGYVQGVNAQNPTLTINGGLFTGGLNTVKNDDNGVITINGGTFTNVTQAAFQNHNVATITGGTFDAPNYVAILNCGVCSGTYTGGEHKLTITNGKFNGAITKTVGAITISGGYFTVDPTTYCASGKIGLPNTDAATKDAYPFVVGEVVENVEPAPAAPEAKADTAGKENEVANAMTAAVSAITGENNKTAVEGLNVVANAEASKVTSDEVNGASTALTDANIDIQNETVTVYVQPYLDIAVTNAKVNYDNLNAPTAVTMDIVPMVKKVASTAADAEDIELTGTNKNAVVLGEPKEVTVNTPVTLTLPLPNNFVAESLKVKHEKNGKFVCYHAATYNENDKTVTFTNDKGFSTFTVLNDSRDFTVQYTDKDGANEGAEVTYTALNVGDKLPTTTAPSGKVFSGWKFEDEDVSGTYTTLTEELLEALGYRTQTIKATPVFTSKSSNGGSGSSGGSSSGKTTYKVTTSAVNNGGVNASPSSAEKGAAITITLSPDKGYKLDKLTVTDGSGKTVSTVKKSDTVYTFTMPASAVKVGVSYVKATETPSETKFNDVSANDWFASAVDYVTGKGMMNGTADNTFSPKANTTRGMVVTVLYRLENQPSTSAASFTDVASGAYYANAVAWANANGIVSGYGSGKFGPNDKVTREQLAAILYRYAQYKKYDVSGANSLDGYADAQTVSSYAVPALQWANAAGVVTGKSGSKLDPKGNATRAEVAAMLMRFCENVK